uniref:Ovule protein n=1 Tax=Haemonchus contortus TaxID=6289 RepID=A0A7I4YHC4_HAECO
MESILMNFYSNLFESDHGISTEQIPIGEMVPSFYHQEFVTQSNQCRKEKPLEPTDYPWRPYKHVAPDAWRKSKTILLFKKGDKEDLDNYRPITLLPVIYKVFTRWLLARMKPNRSNRQVSGGSSALWTTSLLAAELLKQLVNSMNC